MGVKCILFDLDGTLVSTGGAGARALEKAFVSLYNLPRAMEKVNPAGKTDPAIIREIFSVNFKRNCDDSEMESVQARYLAELPGECRSADDYAVMERIPELLSRLQTMAVVMGLGTGNIERGARIKLERSGLNAYLPFGGFGSDAEERSALLLEGKRKAERFLEAPIEAKDVWIVGDTERDIWAARAAGFNVIAVATGHMNVESLNAHKPDVCLPDFSDVGRFVDIIFS